MNVSTGFGAKVHRGQVVKFVIHSRFGKIAGPLTIPACSGIRLTMSLDHIAPTDEPVTCERCGGGK